MSIHLSTLIYIFVSILLSIYYLSIYYLSIFLLSICHEDFEHTRVKTWMESNWRAVCAYASGLYMLLIFGGQHYMAKRQIDRLVDRQIDRYSIYREKVDRYINGYYRKLSFGEVPLLLKKNKNIVRSVPFVNCPIVPFLIKNPQNLSIVDEEK